MDKVTNNKVPSNLILTVCLSCGMTIATSIVYVVLCILAIHYRSDCDSTFSSPNDTTIFVQLFLGIYFTQAKCSDFIHFDNITTESTVFALVIIILSLSILNCISAIVCVSVVNTKKSAQNIEAAVYTYIIISVSSLIVDFTAAIFFGMDYNTINSFTEESMPGTTVFLQELLSLGALLLMTVSLKGFVFHVINIILLIIIIFYLIEYRKNTKSTVHAIHKMGALQAFEQQKSTEDPWQQQPETIFPPYRSNHTNPVFVNDDDSRSQNRDTPRAGYANPAFDRSYSWNNQSTMSPRPFSYLEESKPPMPAKPPSLPSNGTAQWQRERDSWQPSVPAPDYSPDTPRRLKSALKSSYM
ncbi:uncharacterized protein LOC131849207 isoform X2 [Achroia grisella]|uniref:uncharacterized protein LOC131849207 isoform X2 n=1 Tax=Achroia grisella TaxID=688607 RepID=UPI0027D20D8F|nr:uncharacterized protein LOC131849207 isoform X2 [Achroia grisella]